jgi:hypothetical protein
MIIDTLLGYLALGLIGSTLYIIYYQIYKTDPDERLFKEKPLEDALMLPLGLLVSAIAWPYFIYAAITHKETKDQEPFSVNFDDLADEMTLSEIEEKHLIIDPLESVPGIPFGFLNTAWEGFIKSEYEVERIFSFEKSYQRYSQNEVNKGYAAVNSQQQVTHYFIYESYYQGDT